MGEHEGVEPGHAGLLESPQDRPAGRPRIHQHRGAVELQQRRVALSDIEERDDELAGTRLAAARRRASRERHEQSTAATAVAPATPAACRRARAPCPSRRSCVRHAHASAATRLASVT